MQGVGLFDRMGGCRPSWTFLSLDTAHKAGSCASVTYEFMPENGTWKFALRGWHYLN